MKPLFVGVVVGVVLCALLGAGIGSTPAHSQVMPLASSSLVVNITTINDTTMQLTLVDPATYALCVYHVDKRDGKITLRSVRRIQWDMQMSAFNTGDPQPLSIRQMIGGN